MLVTARPAFPLASVLESIWHYAGPIAVHGREHVLPDGRFQIVLNLATGKGAVSGLRSHYSVIDTSETSCMMGVVARPRGVTALVRASALDFCERSVPLDAVWGVQASALIEQLRNAESANQRLRILEAGLGDRVRNDEKVIHPIVDYALGLFNTTPHVRTIADVSRDVGCSRRWFSHVFSEHVGITPKRYCRLVRFQNVVRQIASDGCVEWADAAVAGGFSDQSHLVHEFRAFCGLSPERYLAADRPFPNHVRAE